MKKFITFIFFVVLLSINLRSQTPQLIISSYYDSIDAHSQCNIVNQTVFHISFYGNAANINPLTDSLILEVNWGDGSILYDTLGFSNTLSGLQWGIDINDCYHSYTSPGVFDVKCIATSKLTGAADTLFIENYALVGSSCDTICGKIYQDLNQNCMYDTGEPNHFTFLQLYYNDTLLEYHSYNLLSYGGKYIFYVSNGLPGTGQYKVKIQNSANNFNTCPSTGSYTVTSLPSINNDFGFQCLNNQTDLICNFNTGGFRIFPTQQGNLNICASNIGCIDGVGKVKLVLDPRIHAGTYASPSYQTIIPATTGDTIVWNNNTFSAFYYNQFFTNLISNPTVNIGDTLIFIAIINGVNNEINLSNNVDTAYIIVGSSWDPNDIQVSPIGNIPNNTQLDYYIRFQNTGNAAASRVVVIDTLDASLDINSVVFKGSKHIADMEKLASNVLKFTFEPIYLPDSGSDFEGSMGFFAFSVKPVGYLPIGTQLFNKAYIYFDSNPYVATNTVINTIDSVNNEPSAIIKNSINELTLIYPNPASDFIKIIFPEEPENSIVISIYNINLKLIASHICKSKTNQLSLNGLENGFYYVRILNQNKLTWQQLIIAH